MPFSGGKSFLRNGWSPRKSVTFQVDTATALKVAALVAADTGAARSVQTEMTGELMTYALVELKPDGKIKRYLCYQARPSGPIWKVTLLYLEGILNSMFEKQENDK